MGLDYFARQCLPGATETDVLTWCVTKEGVCCGVCSDTLASLGTRVGLTFAVFFATLVLTIDGPETPFVFLTTSLQALAYLLVVLWEGLGGRGISRFHSYYALVCSFGWMAPLAAASLTATHYGYGGNQTRSGERLLEYRTNIQRSIARQRHSIALNADNRFSDLERSSVTPLSFFRSSSSSPIHDSTRVRYRQSTESGTPSDSSPVLTSQTEAELVPIMSRRRSQRIPEDLKPPRSFQRRHTPASLLGLSTANLSDNEKNAELKQLHADVGAEAPIRHHAASQDLVDFSARPRHSAERTYDDDQLRKVTKRVNRGRWRRWGYPLSIVVLWLLWLSTFLLISDVLPGFTLSQTNCQDPKGTDLLRYSALIFLGLCPVVVLAFVLNYHTQWLPRQLRRVFDFNRSGSAFTRFLLPGIFSAFVFVLWQALLWQGYNLASQPDSSLVAATEHSTTFATVLSLALTIKPVTDLVKALTKIRKRKIRERRNAQHSSTLPGHTPTVLPDLSFSHLPNLPNFEPLGPCAIKSDRGKTSPSSRRTGSDAGRLRATRRHSYGQEQPRRRSPSSSVPSSQQSSLLSSGATDIASTA